MIRRPSECSISANDYFRTDIHSLITLFAVDTFVERGIFVKSLSQLSDRINIDNEKHAKCATLAKMGNDLVGHEKESRDCDASDKRSIVNRNEGWIDDIDSAVNASSSESGSGSGSGSESIGEKIESRESRKSSGVVIKAEELVMRIPLNMMITIDTVRTESEVGKLMYQEELKAEAEIFHLLDSDSASDSEYQSECETGSALVLEIELGSELESGLDLQSEFESGLDSMLGSTLELELESGLESEVEVGEEEDEDMDGIESREDDLTFEREERVGRKDNVVRKESHTIHKEEDLVKEAEKEDNHDEEGDDDMDDDEEEDGEEDENENVDEDVDEGDLESTVLGLDVSAPAHCYLAAFLLEDRCWYIN